MAYRCATFERNRTTGRLFLCGSKILQKRCEEEEKCEKIGQFLEAYILFTTNLISFKFDM